VLQIAVRFAGGRNSMIGKTISQYRILEKLAVVGLGI